MKDVDVEVEEQRTSYYTVNIFDTSESKEKLRNNIKLYFDEGKEKSLDKCMNAGHWAASVIIQKRGCQIPNDFTYNENEN